MTAIGKRLLYRLKADCMFKLRFVDQAANQHIGIAFGGSLAAVACIETDREIFSIVEEYSSSLAQMNASLTRLRDRDKMISGKQSQYTLSS